MNKDQNKKQEQEQVKVKVCKSQKELFDTMFQMLDNLWK